MVLPHAPSGWPASRGPDPEEVRRAVEEVFSDPAYGEITQPLEVREGLVALLGQILRAILDWIGQLGDWSVDLHQAYPIVFWLMISVLLVILVALLTHIAYSARFVFSSVRKGASEQEEREREERKVLHRELMETAHRLAQEGEFSEGIRTLLLALIARFGKRRPGLVLDAWTNHEVAARVPIDEVSRGRLRDLASTVDRVWYGRGPASEADFRDAEKIVRSVSRG